jgi:3-oxoacid CoA-transferase subunit B
MQGNKPLPQYPGSAFFDSATSFGMIRAGRVDLTVLGAMEVAENGDIANWKVPGKMVKGMGGAMDLVASAKNIIVAMQHTDKAGNSKLLPSCSLPITGLKCVKKIVTDLGVFNVTEHGFECIEHAPDVTLDEIKQKTAGKLTISSSVKAMNV